jgi:hypothetical protein
MMRNYEQWLRYLKREVPECIYRHDVDIGSPVVLEHMLDIENHLGIKSVIYIDIYNGIYSNSKFMQLYHKYVPLGFRFGIIINLMYVYADPDEAWEHCKFTMNNLKLLGADIHSVVGKIYNPAYIKAPDYTNRDLESISFLQGYPPSFFKAFELGNTACMLTDAEGVMSCNGVIIDDLDEFVAESLTYEKSFCITHPQYYFNTGSEVYFMGRA